MVVAQDACLRINRGWYSRMGIGSSTSAAAPGAAPVATPAATPEAVKKEVPGVASKAANIAATPPVTPVNGTPTPTPGAAGGKRKGGYRPTKKDKAALKKLKQGKSIGFTMRSSLKAKGLLRRANGTMRISAKYKKN